MERSEDGLWGPKDIRTNEVLDFQFEETLEEYLAPEFSDRLVELVRLKDMEKRLCRVEARRLERRRQEAMPGAATIIQRAWRPWMMNRRNRSATIIQRSWRRLIDARDEEARIAEIESDERIGTALIVLGSYFVGITGVLATSFF
tara:strand:+ start:60 stop:494 length:435 start_codon:yes stop_codon:yes gene_type:complete